MDGVFPSLAKSVGDLIEDEEGGIPASRLLVLGAMAVVLSGLFAVDAYAAHRSHSSHRSHTSHRSGSGSTHGNVSHGSHESHQSHQSHTSHSNSASHSNSLYSSEGDVSYAAPSAGSVPGIDSSSVGNSESSFSMPDVNQAIEVPSGTPVSGALPSFAVPVATAGTSVDFNSVNVPVPTESIE